MPIVLAIEPDRRQAAHLTAIVRHQVGAELVLADTTEGALDAIGNRVPDLVLVPALLSPQDDAALAAALRVIAVAAHVRTLTIPVLASGVTHAPASGMLAKWRKNRAVSPEPDGCDPAVFGEQIATYLQEAAAERAELEAHASREDEPIQAEVAIQSVDAEIRRQTPAPDAGTDTDTATDTHIDTEGSPVVPFEQPWAAAAEPVQLLTADSVEELLLFPSEEPPIDLSDEHEELSEEADRELFDREPAGEYTITVDADASELDLFDPLLVLEPPEIAEEVAAALEQIAAAFRVEPRASFVEPVLAEPVFVAPVFTRQMFVEPPEAPRADIDPWVPLYLTPGRIWPALEGVPAETPVARTEQPDWLELVASLRQDLERRRTDPASALTDPIAARPSEGGDAGAHRLVKKPRARAKQAKPVQDEWGFFDPERCGFSTLLAKLEEITEEA